MRTDKTEISERDTDGIEAVIPVKSEATLFAQIKPKKGHTLFEINPFAGTCIKAVYESVDAILGANGSSVHRRIIKKEKHIYISALNQHNALKKFFNKAKQQVDKIKNHEIL